jgi:hypothetical protein
MTSFSEHLQGKLASLNSGFDQPARSLPRERRSAIYKGRGAPAADHRAVTLIDGEGFTWDGYPRRMRLTRAGPDAAFTRDGFGRWLDLREGCGVPEITALYAREGIALLASENFRHMPEGYERRLGLSGVRYESRDLGEQIARCYPSRRLVVLHWAAFSLSPDLLRYVVAGQLACIALSSTRRTRQWRERMAALSLTGDDEDRLGKAWATTWIGGLCGADLLE